uniref:Uncharacterized protein n=1 Tax=Manihot esculenta TaxID=3983 RepID=A0A2C9VFG1_MANES
MSILISGKNNSLLYKSDYRVVSCHGHRQSTAALQITTHLTKSYDETPIIVLRM